jgi:hypothetical protein
MEVDEPVNPSESFPDNAMQMDVAVGGVYVDIAASPATTSSPAPTSTPTSPGSSGGCGPNICHVAVISAIDSETQRRVIPIEDPATWTIEHLRREIVVYFAPLFDDIAPGRLTVHHDQDLLMSTTPLAKFAASCTPDTPFWLNHPNNR